MKALLNLFKLRIGVAIALTAVAGLMVSPGTAIEPWQAVVLTLAVLAGAAAVSPHLSAEALVLALVLFLWTPPHFWSLSIVFRDDYAEAGVPMLPVVMGDRFAAWAIFGHAVVMVALSLVLALLSPGWLYLVCAASGGALLVWRAAVLALAPSRAHALASFHASLIQLSLLLLGTIADGWMRAALGA